MTKRENDTDPVISFRFRVMIGNFHGALWVHLVAGFVYAQFLLSDTLLRMLKGCGEMRGKKPQKQLNESLFANMPTEVLFSFIGMGIMITGAFFASLLLGL